MRASTPATPPWRRVCRPAVWPAAPGWPAARPRTTEDTAPPSRPTSVRRPARPWHRRGRQAGKITVGTKFDQPGFGLATRTASPRASTSRSPRSSPAKLGIAAEDITWIETVSADRESFIQNGQVDFVVATYTINDARKQLVAFAGPYYEAARTSWSQGHPTTTIPDDPQGRQERLLGRGLDARRRTSGTTTGGSTTRSCCSTSTPIARTPCANGQVDAVTTDNVILLGLVSGSPGASSSWSATVHQGAVRHRPEPGHGVPQLHQRRARGVFEDGSWAEAWDRTAGSITGTEAPEPPSVNRY